MFYLVILLHVSDVFKKKRYRIARWLMANGRWTIWCNMLVRATTRLQTVAVGR